MTTIGLVTLPESGHINPSLRLWRELRDVGHDVRYIATLENAAAFRERHLPVWRAVEQPNGHGHSWGVELEFRPDVVIIDTFLPYVAIWAWGQNCTVLNMSIPFPRGFDPSVPPLTTAHMPAQDDVERAAVEQAWAAEHHRNVVVRREWLEWHRRLARDHGFPLEWLDEHSAVDITVNLPELVLAPQELDFRRRSSSAIFYCGPCVELSRPEEPLEVDCASGELPILYCSFGTQLQRYKEVGERLRLVMGAAEQLAEFKVIVVSRIGYPGPIPSNVVVLRHAPQLALLRQSSVMISHGGINGTVEALTLGVPLIILPFDMDQAGNGARVVNQGVGAYAQWSEIDATSLAQLVRNIHGDVGVADRVSMLSRRLRAMLTEPLAARAFTQCLACHVPKEAFGATHSLT